MLKAILTIFFGGLITLASAQNKHQIIASIQYKVSYSKAGKTTINDICQLDLSKDQSYFYSTGELENRRRISAQLEKSQSSGAPLKISYGDYIHQLCPFKILKVYNKREAFYIQDIGGQKLAFLVDTLSQSRWKIQPGTEKIANMICHKAVMKKDTINITAWFTTDIPFGDGPNYYYGLPGLIVKATTDTGFNIDFMSIIYNKDTNKQLAIPSYTLVKAGQMERAMHNQDATFRQGHLPNGSEVKRLPGN